jgi:hypothetical protein
LRSFTSHQNLTLGGIYFNLFFLFHFVKNGFLNIYFL